MKWYTDLGLAGERLRLREHDKDELSHYSVRHGRHRVRLPVPLRREFEKNEKLLGIKIPRELRSALVDGGDAFERMRYIYEEVLSFT